MGLVNVRRLPDLGTPEPACRVGPTIQDRNGGCGLPRCHAAIKQEQPHVCGLGALLVQGLCVVSNQLHGGQQEVQRGLAQASKQKQGCWLAAICVSMHSTPDT